MVPEGAKRQFNVYLPEELVKRVKHAAIEAEARLNEFVEEALRRHLARVEKKRRKR
jgi:predicted HicB family RNase H-like nuclease